MILTAMFFLIYMMVANVSLEAYGEHANNGGPDRSKRDTDIEKDMKLIFAQGPTIKLLSNNTTYTIVNSPHSPREAVHLDVDCRSNMIYWAVNGDYHIYKAKWGRRSVSPKQGTAWISNIIVGGLAYDWIGQTLYFTNTATKEISSKNEKGIKYPYSTLLEPGKLVLDPLAEYLFWVENYVSFDYVESRIARAPLKPSSPYNNNNKLIRYILESLPNVNSLTLDYDSHLIYWIQLGDNKIRSTNYHGKLGTTNSHFTDNRLLLGITIFQDWFYWSQLDKVFSIYKMHTRYDKRIKNIRNTTLGWLDPEGGYGAIQICHKLRQHFPWVHQYVDVYHNLNDTIEIELKKPDVIFAQGTKIKQFSLANKITTRTLVFSTVLQREAAHLDVDCQNNRVFYAVSGGTSIYMGQWSKEETGPSPDQLLINSSSVGGVAYNWLNDSIYWTDTKQRAILKANSKGKDWQVLYHLTLEPAEIVLVPQSRMKFKYILWSANYFLNGNAVSNIMRAPLRGQNITKPWEGPKVALVQGIPPVKSLALDYDGYRIYWAQIDDGKIRSTTFTGTDPAIKTAVELEDPKNRLLLSIAYFKDWLYWTEFDNVFYMYKKNTKDGRLEKIRNTRRGWLEPEGGYGAIQICHVLRQEPENHTAN